MPTVEEILKETDSQITVDDRALCWHNNLWIITKKKCRHKTEIIYATTDFNDALEVLVEVDDKR
jgi:hypothetical protein